MSLAESGIGAACFAEVTQPGTHGLHQNHTKPILPTYVAVGGVNLHKSKTTPLIQRLWQARNQL